MISQIKKNIKNYPIITAKLAAIRLKVKYTGLYWRWKILRLRSDFKKTKSKKPTELQLPITYKCNFDCVMCGMRKMAKKKDFTVGELESILKDPLFSEIKSVGINGGEPFSKKNLMEYFNCILDNLPKLKNVFIISNGYFTDKILSDLEEMKKTAAKKAVKLNFSLSLDGIGEAQDFLRGQNGAFEKIAATIDAIFKCQSKYVDNFNVICTITKHNVYLLPEVEEWCRLKNVNALYNIATVHERVYNYEKYDDFSVFSDPLAKKSAEEFFFTKFRDSNSERYYCLYKYIQTGERYASCTYQGLEGVTLTPDCQLSYCATHSKELGNALEISADTIFESNKDYQYKLVKEKCVNCSHYGYSIKDEKYKEYINEIVRRASIFDRSLA